jgi:hypothetical protein
MPCKDNDACNTALHDNDHDENDHQESCSPFCMCSCCGQFYTQAYMSYTFELKECAASNQSTAIAISNFLKVYFVIWQPPKL